jgi:hypothetical protein
MNKKDGVKKCMTVAGGHSEVPGEKVRRIREKCATDFVEKTFLCTPFCTRAVVVVAAVATAAVVVVVLSITTNCTLVTIDCLQWNAKWIGQPPAD